jgi:hypothetical protein
MASASLAAPLPVGGSILVPGQAGPVGGVLAAPPLIETLTSPTFTGTLVSEVIAGDASNPFGGLTFVYQVTNNLVSPDAIERVTIDNYTGFTVDASYQTPAAGQIPTLADRPGDQVGFSFINPVPAIPGFGHGVLAQGATSALLVLQTNAPAYAVSVANVIDGSVASVPSYSPAIGPNTPEPSTLALGGLGLAGMALVAWRRAKARR